MITKQRLGEMLVESDLLTEDQLEKALAGQKKEGVKLGQYLIRQSIVSEMQIGDLLCRQLKIGKYHPDQFPIDMGLSGVIPL